MTEPSTRDVSFWMSCKWFGLGLAGITAVNLLGSGLGFLFSSQEDISDLLVIAALYLVLIFAAGGFFFLWTKLLTERVFKAIPGFIILLISGGMLMAWFPDNYRMHRGEEVRRISIEEAPIHHQAIRFFFLDGQPQPQMIGQSKKNFGKNSVYLFVAPVVSSHWDKTKPVPAWAVFEKTTRGKNDTEPLKECLRQWQEPSHQGISLNALNTFNHRTTLGQLITQTEKQHGVFSAPDAPWIRWVASVEQSQQQQCIKVFAAFGGSLLIWSLFYWVAWLIKRN